MLKLKGQQAGNGICGSDLGSKWKGCFINVPGLIRVTQ